MKPEVLEKKILEINHNLRENIKKHPDMDGTMSIIIHFRTGGMIDFQINTEERKQFRLYKQN